MFDYSLEKILTLSAIPLRLCRIQLQLHLERLTNLSKSVPLRRSKVKVIVLYSSSFGSLHCFLIAAYNYIGNTFINEMVTGHEC